MREFKSVKLDGKGNDLVRLDGKGSDIVNLDRKGDLDYMFKSVPGEDRVKPVPATYGETPKYTKPESLFASEGSEPTDFTWKGHKVWPGEHKVSSESPPDEFTWKGHKVWPGEHKVSTESSPDEFTWKFSEQGFKSDPERAPLELKRETWPSKWGGPDEPTETSGLSKYTKPEKSTHYEWPPRKKQSI